MKLLARIAPDRILLLILCLYTIGYAAHAAYLGTTVYGDGRFYYAWLSGVPSKFSVGPALFWSPLYVLTHNQFVIGYAGVLASVFALIILYDTFTHYYSNVVSIMTVASVAGATNLLFYGSLDTVNSHALTFFAATIYLVLLLRRRSWFVIGLALGFLGLMRAQDLVFSVLVIPFITKKNVLHIILGLLLAFTPQLFAWYAATGKVFVSPYLTGQEGFDVLHPHVIGVLFNRNSGLFLWTPMTLIGLAGLLVGKKYLFALVFFAELFIVSSWSTWWQGASFSGRMFVSSLPLLAMGIAWMYDWFERHGWKQEYYLLTSVGPLSAINALSIINFLLVTPGR